MGKERSRRRRRGKERFKGLLSQDEEEGGDIP